VGPFISTFMGFLLFEDVPRQGYTFLGLFLVAVGYVGMNMTQRVENQFDLFFPVSKPSRDMLLVTFLWSITPIMERNCLSYVSPIQFGLFVQGISLILAIMVLGFPSTLDPQEMLPSSEGPTVGSGRASRVAPKKAVSVELMGTFVATTVIGFLAFNSFLAAARITYVSFILLAKRLSIILTVFFGSFFSPGDWSRVRFICCVVLQLGCALIYLPEYGFWFSGTPGEEIE